MTGTPATYFNERVICPFVLSLSKDHRNPIEPVV
jgi:hypothetical protein